MSTESPEEQGTRQSNRQPPNITTYSGREPTNFSRTRKEDNESNRDSDNDSPVGNLALTSTTTPFTMVVFDAKLDYVLKDLLGVPIDTETNPTRLAFEEEAITSWWKFVKLSASFIDGIRYLENGIPKYPAKSIIMELQSIRNYRQHLIQSKDVEAHNPPKWDISLYGNWVAYDEQSFLARLSGATSTGTTSVTTTTFNSNSGVTSWKKIKRDHTKFDKLVNDDNYYQWKNDWFGKDLDIWKNLLPLVTISKLLKNQ